MVVVGAVVDGEVVGAVVPGRSEAVARSSDSVVVPESDSVFAPVVASSRASSAASRTTSFSLRPSPLEPPERL